MIWITCRASLWFFLRPFWTRQCAEKHRLQLNLMVLTIELCNEEEAAFLIKEPKRDAVQQDSPERSVSTLTLWVVCWQIARGNWGVVTAVRRARLWSSASYALPRRCLVVRSVANGPETRKLPNLSTKRLHYGICGGEEKRNNCESEGRDNWECPRSIDECTSKERFFCLWAWNLHFTK